MLFKMGWAGWMHIFNVYCLLMWLFEASPCANCFFFCLFLIFRETSPKHSRSAIVWSYNQDQQNVWNVWTNGAVLLLGCSWDENVPQSFESSVMRMDAHQSLPNSGAKKWRWTIAVFLYCLWRTTKNRANPLLGRLNVALTNSYIKREFCMLMVYWCPFKIWAAWIIG